MLIGLALLADEVVQGGPEFFSSRYLGLIMVFVIDHGVRDRPHPEPALAGRGVARGGAAEGVLLRRYQPRVPRILGFLFILSGSKTMDYTAVKKQALRLFIAFLGLTALIAIASVLGGEFGSLQIKILVTCFTISAASICSMSCAAFIEKNKRTELGLSGIVLSIIAAVLVILGVWMDFASEDYWKTTATFSILAIAFAHAFLLALPDLDRNQQWVQLASSVSIGVLALLILVVLWAEIDSEGYLRLIAVVSILVGLETLVVPILMKMRKGEGGTHESLVLEHVEGERYRAADGRVYQVIEIDPTPAVVEDPGAPRP